MMDRDSVTCFLCGSVDICAHRETELIRHYRTHYPAMRLLPRPERTGFQRQTIWPWIKESGVVEMPKRQIAPRPQSVGFRLGVTREDAYRLRRF